THGIVTMSPTSDNGISAIQNIASIGCCVSLISLASWTRPPNGKNGGRVHFGSRGSISTTDACALKDTTFATVPQPAEPNSTPIIKLVAPTRVMFAPRQKRDFGTTIYLAPSDLATPLRRCSARFPWRFLASPVTIKV